MAMTLVFVTMVFVTSLLVTMAAMQSHANTQQSISEPKSAFALDSGFAIASTALGGQGRWACNVADSQPADMDAGWASYGGPDSGAGLFRYWLDRTSIDEGTAKVFVQAQSGQPRFPELKTGSMLFTWDGKKEEWRQSLRVNDDTVPENETPKISDTEECAGEQEEEEIVPVEGPSNFRVTNHTNGTGATDTITLGWDAVPDAVGYVLYDSAISSTPLHTYGNVVTGTITQNKGTTRSYWLAPITLTQPDDNGNGGGEEIIGLRSGPLPVTTYPATPATPTVVSHTNGTGSVDSIRLTWTAVPGAASYQIWNASTGGTRLATVTAATATINQTKGASVNYYVQAFNTKGGSPYRSGARYVLAYPPAPTNLRLTQLKSDYQYNDPIYAWSGGATRIVSASGSQVSANISVYSSPMDYAPNLTGGRVVKLVAQAQNATGYSQNSNVITFLTYKEPSSSVSGTRGGTLTLNGGTLGSGVKVSSVSAKWTRCGIMCTPVFKKGTGSCQKDSGTKYKCTASIPKHSNPYSEGFLGTQWSYKFTVKSGSMTRTVSSTAHGG